jgi:hypothetical protein|tara:strand:- start:31 stop:507 length:477 start_codon:yes stop_codon:yes gene_type:complete
MNKGKTNMNDEQKELNEEKLLRLKRLSHNLDEAFTIPGTERKIGIDPIIGLIPGGGDLIGGALSIYIMHAGIRMGMPRSVIIRMFGNIALEFIIGCIPIIGDLFDAMWKSNQRNVKLIEDSIISEEKNTIFGYFLIGVLIKTLVTAILLAIIAVSTVI